MIPRTQFRLSLLVLGLLCSYSHGVKEYYSLSRSYRALGMGGAFYGLSDDQHALFYNPAGMGFRKKGSDFKFQVQADGASSILGALGVLTRQGSFTVGQVISDLEAFQGNPISGNVTPLYMYYARKNFAFGLLAADTKVNLAILGSDLDMTADVTAISDTGVFFGFSLPVAVDGLFMGFTVKALGRAGGRREYTVVEIAQGDAFSTSLSELGGVGVGIDFDAGITYETESFIDGVTTRTSLVLSNGLASRLNLFQYGGSAPPALPRMLSIGTCSEIPGFWWFDKFKFLLDIAEISIGGESDPDFGARNGSFWKHVNFGIEFPFASWAVGRMGFHQGNFTAGIGLDARFFELDFATYAEELASLPGQLSSRRYAARIAFGWGGGDGTVPSATETTVPTPAPAPAAAEPPREPQSITPEKEKVGVPTENDRFQVDKAVKESY